MDNAESIARVSYSFLYALTIGVRGNIWKDEFRRCPILCKHTGLFVRCTASQWKRYSVSKSFYLVIRFSVYPGFFRLREIAHEILVTGSPILDPSPRRPPLIHNLYFVLLFPYFSLIYSTGTSQCASVKINFINLSTIISLFPYFSLIPSHFPQPNYLSTQNSSYKIHKNTSNR